MPVWGQTSVTIPGQAIAPPLHARAGSRAVTAEWLVGAARSSRDTHIDPAWLPDNRSLVFGTAGGPKVPPHIERLDIQTSQRTALGDGNHPRPSPDGRWIAYTRVLHDTLQLWVMTSNGQHAHRVFAPLAGAPGSDEYGYSYSFAWAPDSRRIAVAQQPFQPLEVTLRPILQTDTTRSSAVERSALHTPPPEGEMWIIDAGLGQSDRILRTPGRLLDVQWFPDGSAVMFVNGRYGYEYGAPRDVFVVQAIRVRDHRVWTLAAPIGMQQTLDPALSPDGTQVVFSYDADHPLYDFQLSLGLASTVLTSDSAPAITRVTHEMQLHGASWAPNGKMLYARRQYGAYTQVYRINPTTGTASQLTRDTRSVEEYAVSPDGKRLAWSGRDFHGRLVLCVGTLRGGTLSDMRDLLRSDEAPADMALSEVREVEWHTPGYPNAIRGLVVLPLKYQQEHRYPLFIDMHGGGLGVGIRTAGGLLVKTPLEWQLWAAKGIVVFVPDYRSSAQYGSLAIRQVHEQQTELTGDISDVMAGVDMLIASGLVDSARMVAFGHSAGGRRANWLAVTTHRFRGIVSKEGWADNYLDGELLKSDLSQWLFNGTPVTAPEHYFKESAIYHARGARTPTLFIMGALERGGVDRRQSVLWLYHALEEQKVETRYVLYPDEGHVFQRVANQRDLLRRVMQWVDAHLR
jgi:Tol biopolymer transport system component/acetyl esterase/lipase